MSNITDPVFKCTATGDAMVTRRLPCEGEYDGFSEVQQFILKGDFRFGNLETTVHNFESCGGAQSGGSWLCSPPGVIKDMRKFGMNVLCTANNHALDYSYGGLLKTIEYLEKEDFIFTGTGRTLSDASRPVYLDTINGRYALIGCTMTFNPECMAGEQTASLPGRPGVNGIRVTKKFHLPKEELEHLKRIADTLSLNASSDIIRAEGYLPQLKEGEQPIAQMMFEAADKPEVVSTINETDMKRITDAIAEARFMADYVVVAMHNHQIDGKIKENVDSVSIEFSRKCIDEGADAVIGTGPHLLRPMEIYKGKPIFYCLGDFINQLETIQRAPDGMFAKQKLNGNERLDVLFNNRSGNGTRGLSYSKVMFESVIPYWEVQNGELTKLQLLPIEEHFALPRSRHGWPKKDVDSNIIERFAEMSKPWGVDIQIENGIGVVQL